MATRPAKTYKLAKSTVDGTEVTHLVHPWLNEPVCKAHDTAENGEGTVQVVDCQPCIGWMLYNGYLTK